MQNEKEIRPATAGKMKKRQITMADGRRYLIFYTFEDEAETPADGENQSEDGKNV